MEEGSLETVGRDGGTDLGESYGAGGDWHLGGCGG